MYVTFAVLKNSYVTRYKVFTISLNIIPLLILYKSMRFLGDFS